jgi:UDP-N-acetylglucosamine transferase subunit ALG13
VVVTHAGIGSLILALTHGKHPIVMPRRHALGESVDDHQVAFANRLQQAGYATVVNTQLDLEAAVLAGGRHPTAQPPARRLAEALAQLIGQLGQPPPAPTRRITIPPFPSRSECTTTRGPG